MTHVYVEEKQVPVTVVKAGPLHVVQRKTVQKDGYDAVQAGFAEKKPSRTGKAMAGHFKKAGTPSVYRVAEFKADDMDSFTPGKVVNCSDVFKVGDYVDVTSRCKGKGFAGVVRRWKFAGGPKSHGSMMNRAPGSIGRSSDPSRVVKGMRMGGHMGDKNVTIQNLKVVGVMAEDNILLIKGAIPGAVGAYLKINKALKKGS